MSDAPTLDPGIADAINKILDRYPSYAWAFNNPEIAALLWQGAEQEWSPEVFQSKVEATEWWRTTTQSQRAWDQLEATQPQEARTRVETEADTLQQQARDIGASLNRTDALNLAKQSLRRGWTPAQKTDVLAARINFDTPTGAAQRTSMEQMTRQWMVSVPQSQMLEWTRDLASGKKTPQAVEEELRVLARNQWPGLAEHIDKGMQPAAFLSNYRKLIGDMTGRDPETVDLMDPKWRRVISHADPGGSLRVMTLDETARFVRGTREYQDSAMGRQHDAQLATKITELLGRR